MPSPEAMTFNDHFKRLGEIAGRLQNQKDVDLERLIEESRQGIESYEYCKARIHNATAEIDALFGQIDGAKSDK